MKQIYQSLIVVILMNLSSPLWATAIKIVAAQIFLQECDIKTKHNKKDAYTKTRARLALSLVKQFNLPLQPALESSSCLHQEKPLKKLDIAANKLFPQKEEQQQWASLKKRLLEPDKDCSTPLPTSKFDQFHCDILSEFYRQPKQLLWKLNNEKILPRSEKDKIFLSLLHTSLFLNEKNYAEALRILFSLSSQDPTLKLLYNHTQVIFAYHQKSSGKVGLRQNL